MLSRLATVALLIVLVIACAAYFFIFFPLRNPHPAVSLSDETLAIRDATVYPSPDDPPLLHTDILIRNGFIADVGPNLDIPANAHIVPCNHCFVTAGFWNTHIHFTQPKWNWSAFKSASTLNTQLADMLTSRGFTTVVDLGSDLRQTVSLRRRIETADLLGPYIYTAGAAQYPPHGIPYYIRDSTPKFLQRLMPQPNTPADAAEDERINIARGADLLKLFTGSYIAHGDVLPMPGANATAAVQIAHDHHQLAFAHPSNLAGVLIARDAGVDVLAHAADTTTGVTPDLLQSLVEHHMAMIPTLKMFATTVTTSPAYLDPIYAEVREFHTRGGTLLFGTDIGYMSDYSTQDEFAALARCGLTSQDILRMLTLAPAQLFHVDDQKGRVARGRLADLVLLTADPMSDPTHFAAVGATIRSGRVLYTRP